MNLKQLFSYFLPIRLKNYPSELNGNLEINLVNGKKVLDTRSSNYSFGSLQRILEHGLKAIHFDQRYKNILVLGMGAGSIVESIRIKFGSDALITLVDIDPVMARIAGEEFGIQAYDGVQVHIKDAGTFVENSRELYDLILVDLFIIATIPEKFTKKPFIDLLSTRLSDQGSILYNTIHKTLPAPARAEILAGFRQNGFETKILENIDYSNDLILASK